MSVRGLCQAQRALGVGPSQTRSRAQNEAQQSVVEQAADHLAARRCDVLDQLLVFLEPEGIAGGLCQEAFELVESAVVLTEYRDYSNCLMSDLNFRLRRQLISLTIDPKGNVVMRNGAVGPTAS